ncbi:MAG: hypothetical protein AAGL17_00255 [Cyanobacteria bacterium J06576_12]
MLKSPILFAISVLVTLISWAGVAKADELTLGLSFELPPSQKAQVIVPASSPANKPARVEIAILPRRGHAIAPEPESVKIDTLQLAPVKLPPSELTYTQENLPPIATEEEIAVEQVTTVEQQIKPTASSDNIALSFDADTVSIEIPVTETPTTDEQPDSAEAVSFSGTYSPLQGALSLDDWIFEHGTHSLVARTVGSAEGTRQADGRRTQAYYGHTDPGNGVWNLGTFSYQHEATSPEDADERQLQRLKRQGIELESQASQMGVTLSLEEKLNGLDLANQAPLAALDRGGYIERLAQAKRLQMKGDEAILWARTHAYIDPDTRRWNAPGLGNNVHSISEDQSRRIDAISAAMKAYKPEDMTLASLTHLEQISLENTDIASSGGSTLTSPTQSGDNQPLFNTASLKEEISAQLPDLEVSFGLPPVDTDIDAVESSDAVIAAEEITEPSSDLEIASVENIDIGVAFSPTGNIADGYAASLSNNEADDLSSSTAESLSLETDSDESLQPQATAEVIKDSVTFQTYDDAAEDQEEETFIGVESAGEESDAVDVDIAESNSDAVSPTASSGKSRLQSLLSGVETPAELERLEALKNDEPEPETVRQFFRTEDKVVREK